MTHPFVAALLSTLLLNPAFAIDRWFASSPIVASKAKTFLEKRDPCYLVVGEQADKDHVYEKTYCVADMTLNKGTVNEVYGCTFAIYDMATNNYMGTYGDAAPKFVNAGKKCSKGGFEELMKMPGISLAIDGSEYYTVESILAHGIMADMESDTRKKNTALLFAGYPFFSDWWNKAVKNVSGKSSKAKQVVIDSRTGKPIN